MNRAGKLVALALGCAASLCLSCKKSPPEPVRDTCYLAVFPAGTPTGSLVFWNGKKIGFGVELGPRYEDDLMAGVDDNSKKVPTELPISLICIPPTTWLSDGGPLSIERKTPCGDKPITLSPREPITRAFEERARQDNQRDSKLMPTIFLDPQKTDPLPSTSVFYLAPSFPLPADTTISIGQASFTLLKGIDPTGYGPIPTTLFGLDCQAKHPVKVNGREIGVLDVAEGAPKGLIINDRGICVRLTNATYGYQDQPHAAAGWDSHLAGPLLTMKKIDRIDYFLASAPGTQSGRHAQTSLIELVEEPCEASKGAPDKSAPDKKGKKP